MPRILDIQADEFNSVVEEASIPVVLEFWVRSCRSCQRFKPVYEKLSEIFGDEVTFLKMNMMKSIENLRFAEDMGVEETPTTKVFCRGREVGEIVGYLLLEEAVEFIRASLESSHCI
ncbi:MAG: thioredoxin family protein [Candidatus Bathyarchaeia archaeon]